MPSKDGMDVAEMVRGVPSKLLVIDKLFMGCIKKGTLYYLTSFLWSASIAETCLVSEYKGQDPCEPYLWNKLNYLESGI